MKRIAILGMVLAVTMAMFGCVKDQSLSVQTEESFSNDYATEQDAAMNKDWPSNEYTAQIPQPDFPIVITGSGEDTNDFAIVFKDVDIKQIKNYVESIKGAGFTLHAEIDEYQVGDTVFYLYEAENEGGFEIEVFFIRGRAGLTIEKP
jgi:hypothetical protein